ncbi:MAG: nitroreductase family deazaflavin-dependent oxidoreductase [Solirubrobacterales bacterium]
MSDYNAPIIEEFRTNDGKVGGPFEGATMLLLHTRGARTGQPRVNPLVYLPDGDRYVVFGSKGGAPTNPDWYHNLIANPDVTIEVGTSTIAVRAREITGPERDELYARQVERRASFADYPKKTDRLIPAIALEPRA